MKSILSIAKGMLAKQKGVNVLIGIILLICFACISSGLTIYSATSNLYKKAIDAQKSMHDVAFFSTNDYSNWEEMGQWFESHELVESVHIIPGSNLSEIAKFKGESINIAYCEMPLEPKHDLLKVVEGESSAYPSYGTIWVPTGFANRYSVSLGDEILIPNGADVSSYKISAIVYDPPFSSSLISPHRVWVSPGEVALMNSFTKIDRMVLTIRYIDSANGTQVWSDFTKWQGVSFNGVKMEYSVFSSGAAMTTQLIAMGILAIGIMLVAICCLILCFIVLAEISTQYKTFGVLKAMGVSNHQIRLANFFQYFALMLISIPFAIVLNIVLSRQIINPFAKALGLDMMQISIGLPLFVAFMIVSLIITIAVVIGTKKIKKINPSQAIRTGKAASKKTRNGFIKIKDSFKVPVGLLIQSKENANSKARQVFSILILVALVSTMFFGIGLNMSLDNFFDDTSCIALPKSDLSIKSINQSSFGYSTDDVYKYLLDKDNIESITKAYTPDGNVFIKIDSTNEYATLVDAIMGDYDEHNLAVIEGHNPKTDNEIAITQITSDQIEKGIGDIITVSINGAENSFVVCGIYQSVNNMGNGIRLKYSAMYLYDPTIKQNWYHVVYDEGVDIEKEKAEVESLMGVSVTILKPKEFLDSIAGPIMTGGLMATLALSFITMIVCAITLYNFSILSFYKQKRNYGIYMVCGVSSKQLISLQLVRISILTLIASAISYLVISSTMEDILIAMFKTTGAVSVDLILDTRLMIGAVLLTMIIGIASVYFASRKLKKLNLRELVIE
ncbi:MAG: ABC transporter permease [Clostridiales bacterium]|nr:ABC transporter permease [Clostridiales bacterium]